MPAGHETPSAAARTADATCAGVVSRVHAHPSDCSAVVPHASRLGPLRGCRRATSARRARTSAGCRRDRWRSSRRAARRRHPSMLQRVGQPPRAVRRRPRVPSTRARPRAIAATIASRSWSRQQTRASINVTPTANASRSFEGSRGASAMRSGLIRRSDSEAMAMSRPSTEPVTCHGTPGRKSCRGTAQTSAPAHRCPCGRIRSRVAAPRCARASRRLRDRRDRRRTRATAARRRARRRPISRIAGASRAARRVSLLLTLRARSSLNFASHSLGGRGSLDARRAGSPAVPLRRRPKVSGSAASSAATSRT